VDARRWKLEESHLLARGGVRLESTLEPGASFAVRALSTPKTEPCVNTCADLKVESIFTCQWKIELFVFTR